MSLRGLYAITDQSLLANGRLLPYVEAALRGGARLLQYRDKSPDKARRRQEAEALQVLCARYGAQLIINDDAELAAQLGAGLHLGQEDGALPAARTLLRPGASLGATCHASLALADKAAAEGADYIAFGSFFPSRTKPGAAPASLALLEEASSRLTLPICAIGGITLDNADRLIQRGAAMLAVIQALFAAPSPSAVEERARAFTRLFH